MNTLSSSLLPKDVHLQLRASNCADALEEVLSPLRSDSRVQDWEKLRSSLLGSKRIEAATAKRGTMILHHGRTESVSGLVLALGRSDTGLPNPGSVSKIHLLVIAAIPETLNNEYLRVLGAVARICGDPDTFEQLVAAPDVTRVIRLLEQGCLQ